MASTMLSTLVLVCAVTSGAAASSGLRRHRVREVSLKPSSALKLYVKGSPNITNKTAANDHEVKMSKKLAKDEKKNVTGKAKPTKFVNTSGVSSGTCSCEFQAECTCNSALVFMECISHACVSSECNCHEHQYHNACVEMSKTCTSLSFDCSAKQATCKEVISSGDEAHTWQKPSEQIQKELEEMYKERCQLNAAARKGVLNADNRLRELKPEIDDHVEQLQGRNATVPEENCNGEVKKPKAKPPAPTAAPAKGSAGRVVLATLALLVAVVAH